tara:strand:+ start:331 stop:1032 length:702 start_codon:yes stop_codon:yes gene_type:complete
MFELSETLEVIAINEVGPEKRNCMLIDNFYKNPDEVRSLALRLPKRKDINLVNHHSGTRSVLETEEIRKNTERLFKELLYDNEFWGRPTDRDFVEKNMEFMPFLVDWIDQDTISKQPLQLLPHQVYYPENPSPFQFTIEIFLNKNMPNCGGTDIWSFAGKTTVDEDMKNMYADADAFSLRKDVYESVLAWKQCMMFGMEFNRAIIIPSDMLQAPFVTAGMYEEEMRLSQRLFL